MAKTAITCPICLSRPYRRLIDAEIIAQVEAHRTAQEIYEWLTGVFFPRNSIDFSLDYEEYKLHHDKHNKIGLTDPGDVVQSKKVMLPTGAVLAIDNPQSNLEQIVLAGMMNILTNPDAVTPFQTLRALELLIKLKGGGGDMEELMVALKKSLEKGPPATFDAQANPLAQQAPPGALHE